MGLWILNNWPPSCDERSKTTELKPRSAHQSEADSPAGPPPTINTSFAIDVFFTIFSRVVLANFCQFDAPYFVTFRRFERPSSIHKLQQYPYLRRKFDDLRNARIRDSTGTGIAVGYRSQWREVHLCRRPLPP